MESIVDEMIQVRIAEQIMHRTVLLYCTITLHSLARGRVHIHSINRILAQRHPWRGVVSGSAPSAAGLRQWRSAIRGGALSVAQQNPF